MTTYVYDTAGRREQEIQEFNGVRAATHHTYDQNNNVISIEDANNKVSRFFTMQIIVKRLRLMQLVA